MKPDLADVELRRRTPPVTAPIESALAGRPEPNGPGPKTWGEALAWLNACAEAGECITQVTVPFDGAPELYTTVWFGAPVIRGDELSARTTSGEIIRP